MGYKYGAVTPSCLRERVRVGTASAAIFGFIGALIASGLGFYASITSTFGRSKDTSKDILTRTVTNERSQWRGELREVASDFIENALRIVDKNPGGSIYTLEKQRALIRFRLNPDPTHVLDATILQVIAEIVKQSKALDSGSLAASLDVFESNVQALLKQEWDKSKREAETGMLDVSMDQSRLSQS